MNMSKNIPFLAVLVAIMACHLAEAQVVIRYPAPQAVVRRQVQTGEVHKKKDPKVERTQKAILRRAAEEQQAKLDRLERAITLAMIKKHMSETPPLKPEQDMFRQYKKEKPSAVDQDEFVKWKRERPLWRPIHSKPISLRAEEQEQSTALSEVLYRALETSRPPASHVRGKDSAQEEDEEE